MNNNIFRTPQTLLNDYWALSKRRLGKHRQISLGLSLLIFISFSVYSPTKGYHIDTTPEQISYDMAFSTLTDSKEPPDPCASQQEGMQQEDIVLGTLFIGVQPEATLSSVRRTLQVDGVRDLDVVKFWPEFNLALVRVPNQDSSPIIAAHGDAIQRLEKYRETLEQIPEIRYTDYNSWISVADWTAPPPPTHSEHTRRLSTETVEYAEQDPASAGEAVVALIDSGYGAIDMDNTTYSLWENQAEINGLPNVDDDENGFVDDYNGWDWVDNDNVMDDELGHGIFVGQAILDVIEEQGIDRHSVKIQPLRILNKDGKGEIANLIDALAYAARNRITIINISLVSYYNSPALEQTIENVHQKGLLTISPVSLCTERIYWPAAYPETLATSTLCGPETENEICFINETVDIAVQLDASDVISTSLASSASLAPSHVTAAAALILRQHPNSSNNDLTSVILSTATSSSPEDSSAEILILDIDAIVEELETPSPNLNGTQLNKKLYLPLIAN